MRAARDDSVVVTGLGIVSPAGVGEDRLWDLVTSGRSALGPIARFDTADYRCHVGGEISGFEADAFVDGRIIKQTDRMTHLAMAACTLALRDAGLETASMDTARLGMYLANVFGGMEFAERELFAQTFLSPSRVSAYQSIAWFYAASQGQWSIANGVRGVGKSIVGDRVGGLQALLLALLAIRQGQCDVAIAGGFEAPFAPYVYAIHEASGHLADGGARAAYRPFDRDARGMVLGEGAAMLVLERRERAEARGARIYAELAGGAMNIDAAQEDAPAGCGLAGCVEAALDHAGLAHDAVAHVFPDGAAIAAEDRCEVEAFRRLFSRAGCAPAIHVPKRAYGHMLAAAGPADAAIAAKMLHSGRALARCLPETPIDPLFAAQGEGDGAVLCCGRGFAGLNAAIVLRRTEAPS